MSDFAARSSGAVRAHRFRTQADLGPEMTSFAVPWGWQRAVAPSQPPALDAGPEDSGSMRIDILPGTGQAQPFFLLQFSDDGSIAFGAGDRFSVQWRERYNAAFVNTVLTSADGTPIAGTKHMTVTSAGSLGMHDESAMQLVTLDWWQHKFLTAMGDNPDGTSGGFWDELDGDRNAIQNATAPVCSRRVMIDNGIASPGYSAGCFGFVPDEWMTYELFIDLSRATLVSVGPRYVWDKSAFQLWGARENQAPVQLIDWHPGLAGYRPLDAGEIPQCFGKMWCAPHSTGKSPAQQHPVMSIWYAELLVSRAAIPFPGGFALSTTPTTAQDTSTMPVTQAQKADLVAKAQAVSDGVNALVVDSDVNPLQTQLDAANAQVTSLTSQVNSLTSASAAKDQTISTLNAKIAAAKIQAQADKDADNASVAGQGVLDALA
jgi:hypothetical protein